ncbi:MAG TPA: hypothetical protein VMH04_20475 [Candidatus Solibacter sp.]|jgi:hypothetical protein|nr:hypothetical protein [Candidatus Solibacter sp.]
MICTCVAARAQDVVIVVNRNVTLSAISAQQLREVFTGVRSRLGDGTRAVPVVLKGGPAHEVFLRNHVGDNPQEFRARWRKAVFTGEGAMPKEFGSEAALLDYVAVTPGAIGYVSRVQEVVGVRVLTVTP